MRLGKIWIVLVAVLCQVSLAQAAFVLNVGNIVLQPNMANQKVPLTISSLVTDPLVTGFNLRAQIGDGTGLFAEPDFTNISYNGAGSIWNAFPNTVIGGPFDEVGIDGPGPFVQSSVVFNASVNSVAASGFLVELTISTVGFSSGSFPLLFSESEIGSNSNFILAGGAEAPIQITNGTLTIQPIPEPSLCFGLSLIALCGMGWMLKRS